MNPPAADPGSLERLHDIAVPPPAPWFPPAPAWYVLAALVGGAVAVLLVQSVARRARNRYRRAGLSELATLEASPDRADTLPALAELLKRVALAGFPRDQVASLSGAEWLRFLDRTGRTADFVRGPGACLLRVYDARAAGATPELYRAVRHWIKHHRTGPPC